jgi:hypothetical protein
MTAASRPNPQAGARGGSKVPMVLGSPALSGGALLRQRHEEEGAFPNASVS